MTAPVPVIAPVIAVGIGCRAGCPAAEIATLVRQTLAGLHLAPGPGMVLSSLDGKAGSAAIAEAAATLKLPLRLLALADLQAMNPQALSRSAASLRSHGLASLTETAALAALGHGARLLAPRALSQQASCAVARLTQDETSS